MCVNVCALLFPKQLKVYKTTMLGRRRFDPYLCCLLLLRMREERDVSLVGYSSRQQYGHKGHEEFFSSQRNPERIPVKLLTKSRSRRRFCLLLHFSLEKLFIGSHLRAKCFVYCIPRHPPRSAHVFLGVVVSDSSWVSSAAKRMCLMRLRHFCPRFLGISSLLSFKTVLSMH